MSEIEELQRQFYDHVREITGILAEIWLAEKEGRLPAGEHDRRVKQLREVLG